jgi:hypothetical protein
MSDRNRQDELERQLTRVLRDQPVRRAPSTLERRVLAQIEAGAVASSWRRGFAHWPMAARLVFLAASVGVAKLALMIGTWIASPLESPAVSVDLPSQVAWMQTLLVAIGNVVRAVPSMWVHVGLIILALMYAALFGIGATAYRTMRPSH